MTSFEQQLCNATVYRKSRDFFRDSVLKRPELIKQVTNIAFDLENEFHYKGCWIIELLALSKIELLLPYLDKFCNTVSMYRDDSAIRVMAKTTFLIVKENYSQQPLFELSTKQIEQLTACAIDWLISDQKVAAKSFAAETLFILGKHQAWIYPELKQILSDGYNHHSAAYKATARKIIGQIK